MLRHPVRYYLGHWANLTIPLHTSFRIKLKIYRIMFFEYYCLNIIVNINSFIALNISVNTHLKYCYSQALNEILKLMRGTIKHFSKMLLGHEILSSLVPWDTKFYLENL